MKLKHSIAFILAALILSSCMVVETTSPDGTVTKTTAIIATGVAIGAMGAASAYNSIEDAK
jgi:hypothetical protein